MRWGHVGFNPHFLLEMIIRNTAQTVEYIPNLAEMLKFAWIQCVATTLWFHTLSVCARVYLQSARSGFVSPVGFRPLPAFPLCAH